MTIAMADKMKFQPAQLYLRCLLMWTIRYTPIGCYKYCSMDRAVCYHPRGKSRVETLIADQELVVNSLISLHHHHLLRLLFGPTKGGGKDYGELRLSWRFHTMTN